MNGATYVDTLQRGFRNALFWGLGLALLSFYMMILAPNTALIEQYKGLLEAMPPALLQALGVSNVEALGTPEGFIAFGAFTYTILMLAVYAVNAGMNVTANDEDNGMLDMVLALPLSRTQMIVERFLGYASLVGVIVALFFSGILVGHIVTGQTAVIDFGRLALGAVNILPSVWFMIAVTVLISALVPRKSTATAIVSGFIGFSYFVYFLANAASQTPFANIKLISFFTYYNSENVVQNGLQWGQIGVLISAAVLCVVIGIYRFDRRDVGL